MKILRNPLADKAEKICQTERGFSLIEILGVLAIMGILASMTVPPILRQIRQAQTVNEDANLNEVARAIVEGIKATGKIPNPNLVPYGTGGWADVAYRFTTLTDDTAPGGGFAPGTLHYVFPAEANFSDVFGTSRTYADTARRVYLDPVFLAYLESLFGGISGIFNTPADGWPETTTGGINFPNQAIKLFVVSSSRPDFVLSCPTNGLGIQVSADSYRATLVNELVSWIKVIDSATGFIKVPGAAIENWPNNGHQFLHVKTIDLRPLFCKVTLIDTAAPEDIAGFNVAVAGVGYTPSSSVMVSYLNNNITFQTLPADTFTDTSGNGTWDSGEAYNDINADGAYNNTGALNNSIIPTLSLASSYNARHVAIPNTVIPPGTAQYAGPASPNAPTYDLIAAVGPGAGGFLPSPDPTPPVGLTADHNQTQTFYVLKGQAINLFDGANALNKSVTIQSDVQYKYYNNTWSRVD